tara:strand:+ start:2252 stop:3046 length:795 start_codon:yes stop_codon:yes gene_type:complete
MKSLISVLDNGIIIILGLLLLIIGVINVYIYRRVLALERNMIQNSKILQTFMLNQISETRCNVVNSDTINSRDIVGETRNINVNNDDKKIDVSDTEDESVEYNHVKNNTTKVDKYEIENSDVDSDLESEYDSDDDDDNEDECDNGSAGIIEISNSLGDNLDIDNIDIDDLLKTDIDVLDEYGTTKTIELVDNIDIKLLSNTNENNNDNDNDDREVGVDNLKNKKNLGKMKIDDLRVLAVTNSLVGNEESHKLKKAELLKLLQDN